VYFSERLVALGVEDIGQPIEGFDANLLMLAFPGILPSDFDGVQALEGSYRYANGSLTFARTHAQPTSSAERTVAAEGYATLHTQLSRRLGIPAQDTGDVDRIIAAVNTSEHLETRIDRGDSALGVTVVPREVLEDSRCPLDTQCIWAGRVRVRATLESGLGTTQQEFTLGETVTTEAEEVVLIEVTPEPYAGETIEPSGYLFVFEVRKRV